MDVALVLFRRRGELVSRAHLYEQVWGHREPLEQRVSLRAEAGGVFLRARTGATCGGRVRGGSLARSGGAKVHTDH